MTSTARRARSRRDHARAERVEQTAGPISTAYERSPSSTSTRRGARGDCAFAPPRAAGCAAPARRPARPPTRVVGVERDVRASRRRACARPAAPRAARAAPAASSPASSGRAAASPRRASSVSDARAGRRPCRWPRGAAGAPGCAIAPPPSATTAPRLGQRVERRALARAEARLAFALRRARPRCAPAARSISASASTKRRPQRARQRGAERRLAGSHHPHQPDRARGTRASIGRKTTTAGKLDSSPRRFRSRSLLAARFASLSSPRSASAPRAASRRSGAPCGCR